LPKISHPTSHTPPKQKRETEAVEVEETGARNQIAAVGTQADVEAETVVRHSLVMVDACHSQEVEDVDKILGNNGTRIGICGNIGLHGMLLLALTQLLIGIGPIILQRPNRMECLDQDLNRLHSVLIHRVPLILRMLFIPSVSLNRILRGIWIQVPLPT
jgi:hypothetical protein